MGKFSEFVSLFATIKRKKNEFNNDHKRQKINYIEE